MAAFDASASGGVSANVTTLSWTHTPAGTPSKVLVAVMSSSSAGAPDSVTYGGSAMTLIATNTAAFASALRVYEHNTPASGAQTVAITMPASAGRLGGGSVSLTATSTTTATSNTNHDGVPPTATVSSASGRIVVTFAGGALALDPITTPNNTGMWADDNSGGAQAAQYVAGGASVTNSWSSTVTGETATISVDVFDGGGGGAPTPVSLSATITRRIAG